MSQLDEPYMRARPEPAREYGIDALNSALDGVVGTTCVHVCFGYAAIIHDRPASYSFLNEFHDYSCDQVSIETAQSKVNPVVLKSLPARKVVLGVLDLGNKEIEMVETTADRIRRVLRYKNAEQIIVAPDCGMKYLPREIAFGKLKAMTPGAELERKEPLASTASYDK